MTLGLRAAADVSVQLGGRGIALRTGPFTVRLFSDVPAVRQSLCLLYDQYPVVDDDAFCDFTVHVRRVGGLRRWVRPQVVALFDDRPLFEPLPLGHAFPLLEWTLNWCITSHVFEHLTLHAAVVERGGRAAILPAPPGSGKSTLCAALIHRGWRLLSDELALVRMTDGRLSALARPVSLKNRSIEIVRRFAPGAVLSEETHDTSKGTVAHMKVPREHVLRMDETALPAWVVFPRWQAGAAPQLAPRPKADAMMELGRNAFNYQMLGRAGFERLADLVSACDCYDFSYSRLDDAIVVFDRLADPTAQ